MELRRIVIACGGSGGHLAPGIALAEEWSLRGYHPILFVSSKAVDQQMLAKYSSWSVVALPAKPFRSTPWSFLPFCYSQIVSTVRVLCFLKKNPAEAIVVMGGFTSLPVALAGFLKKIPIFIHESNQIPGRATRCLASLARRIYVPRECFLKKSPIPLYKVKEYAYPLRSEFCEKKSPDEDPTEPVTTERETLLLLGGSQGAKALNDWFCECIAELGQLAKHLVCVTGQMYYDDHKTNLERIHQDNPEVQFLPFCDDMPSLLRGAKVVIARAGAGTMAECIQCELPMILVPLPSAADDHQRINAERVQNLGCAYVVKEVELDFLEPLVKWVVTSSDILERMREKIRSIKEENAREQIVDDMLSSLRGESAEHDKCPETAH
ncbi:MAG: UDP-N-acetylglucosamine--N-acetylmuramyl-(pentapeptide) pyrophosphoryl-undecaprenol N-acetylglucosamine transferase [Puniceicoccales bacterium]|jgi:UDP-N-acetylglucosamine--N-acetylmuramyl-(pentapeptide) pyrophosphoryl-undecaprenol N-acetylglucosamine transferase|nr:UDP-N-acetylglucosamine--N-acetylmuramyl-(pentapeptide) pyrophosphoryl-undecaprenol N-acetylglucosamine transferase [Puniceicoccales bacterium]